ncbi:MAG: hypothetical protein IKU52_04000 [Clostridia bacterium]|nr:hypothetical protein [Clostridia bacterium]
MRKILNYSFVFFTGAVCYSLLEILWRGYTHISMALAGGIVLAGLYSLETNFTRLSLIKKCIIGSLFITFIEFGIGCIVNKLMGLCVWDYSDRFLNIMGQICPLYTMLWFVICIPAFGVCKAVNKISFNWEKKSEKG